MQSHTIIYKGRQPTLVLYLLVLVMKNKRREESKAYVLTSTYTALVMLQCMIMQFSVVISCHVIKNQDSYQLHKVLEIWYEVWLTIHLIPSGTLHAWNHYLGCG